MLEAVRQELAAAIGRALHQAGVADAQVALEVPPRRELGDLAWTGALPLAKLLRRPPREIAVQVAAVVEAAISAAPPHNPLALIEAKAAVDGPGFLNVRLRRGPMLASLLAGNPASTHGQAIEGDRRGMKVIVEHTNINPNKSAHIGHLRNAVLGDTLVRCLRYLGHTVETQNYVDDTGVQVADVVVGFLFLPEAELIDAVGKVWPDMAATGSRAGALQALAKRFAAGDHLATRLDQPDFDDLCWELYPRVTRRYEAEEGFSSHRLEVLHAVEGGYPNDLSLQGAVDRLVTAASATGVRDAAATARLAAAVAEANLRCHLATMGAIGVPYDVLPHESDILQRGFWTRAWELLRAAGAIRLEAEGKNAGCWVMSLADSPEFAGMADADKILVRSNGTVTYTGKDIAYQLWKLGLLADEDGALHDFGYRPFARFHQDGPAAPVRYGEGMSTLYRSSSNPAERPAGAGFGAATRVYNVIDTRQSYPQKVVREAITVLGHREAAENSIHFAYEMVALTPKAVRRLEESLSIDFGLTTEDLSKPFIEMSGRRGIGVKADSLLATLVAEAERAVAARQGELGPPGTSRSRAIAVGALRYQMVRQGRNRVLAFDFDEALAFEGDTGPYLQYSAVRARKIFEKLAAAGLAATAESDAEAVSTVAIPDDLWELALACARTGEMVAKAVASLEFSLLASHARDLAQLFHKLYHEHPVLHAPDERSRAVRRGVFRLFLVTISTILEVLLGIPVPEEM
jgi:arginyl-tRNA synthetase